MTLYLKNATYIDWQNFAIKNSHLSVEEGPDGNILFIDTIPSADDLHHSVRRREDRLWIRHYGNGLIDGRSHVPSKRRQDIDPSLFG